MQKILSLCIFIGLFLPFSSTSIEYVRAETPTSSINDLIVENSNKYDVPMSTLIRVIKCESGFDPKAIGDGGLAYGIAQFHKQTFDAFSKEEGETLNYHSTYDQIKLLSWAISKDYGKHWTCFSKVV